MRQELCLNFISLVEVIQQETCGTWTTEQAITRRLIEASSEILIMPSVERYGLVMTPLLKFRIRGENVGVS